MPRFPLADPTRQTPNEIPNFINIGTSRFRDFFVPKSFDRDYQNPIHLGTGGYGIVIGLEGVANNRNGIAIKKFLTPFDTARKAQRCYRELQLLRELDHENIVKMRCIYTTDRSVNHLFAVYLVTEFAGLDLEIRLQQETALRHVYTLNSFKNMISDLLRALKYLNSANVIHRDLKPDNLAISDDGKLTLLDFGIARVVDENNEHTKNPGTKYYRAIETIAFGMNDRQVYNERADIWSIGAILCEMITGSILFKSAPNQSDNPILRSLEICGPIPENVLVEEVDDVPSQQYLRVKSATALRRDFMQYFDQQGRPWLRNEIERDGPALLDFINRTLAFDHRARMSVDEALAHPFLSAARVPHREVLAGHLIPDVGNLTIEEYRQLIWNAIQANPPIGHEFFVPTSIAREYPNSAYLLSGTFGTVYHLWRANRRREGIAVKKFITPFITVRRAQRCYRELQLLSEIDHENIVPMKFAYTTETSLDRLENVYLVTEYCGYDLNILLAQERGGRQLFNLRSIQQMLSELLRALKYLNSANVIHRDLKPDNIAIDRNGKLKLLDFGIARVLDENNKHTRDAGMKYYRAIETFAFDQNEQQVYNEKADIWSIGAILSEMITGEILFKPEKPEPDNPVPKFLQILGPVPEHVIVEQAQDEPSRAWFRVRSQISVRRNFVQHFLKHGKPWLRDAIRNEGAALVNFIDRTLVFDPRARMSVDEALAHSFLAKVRVQEKEVNANHMIADVGNMSMDEWKRLIWTFIQQHAVP